MMRDIFVCWLATFFLTGSALFGAMAWSAPPPLPDTSGFEAQDVEIRQSSEFINTLAKDHARVWTLHNDAGLKKLNLAMQQIRFPYLMTRERARSEWRAAMTELLDGMAGWETAFLIESQDGVISRVVPPAGDAFLAQSPDQPFLVIHRMLGNDALPTLRRPTTASLGDGGLRLGLDAREPALMSLFLSDIQTGAHEYSLTIAGHDGAALYDGAFSMAGVTPARIRIALVDESGAPVEALVGLFPANGRDMPPNVSPIYVHDHEEYWRNALPREHTEDPRAHVVPGPFEMAVYPGPCRVVARKGPEHFSIHETFDAPPGETVEKTFVFRRFADLRAMGWHSGEGHCHINRTPAGERDRHILDLLGALDLGVTHILEVSDEWHRSFLQSLWGEMGRAARGNHAMITGQEAPRTSWRGHTLIYNLQNSINNRENYYVYEDAFKEAKAQGGLTGYAHSAWAFQAGTGTAVSVPLGLVDFIELDNADELSRDALYHYWNMGFPLAIVAGSDFPWAGVPGDPRFYTHIEGDFSFDKYMESLAAGHTYASRGAAFIDLRANGRLPGSRMDLSAGETLSLRLKAGINPDHDRIKRVEIVQNGGVVHAFEPEEGDGDWLERELDLRIEDSGWLAARVFGQRLSRRIEVVGQFHFSAAHTTPIFLRVDGKPPLNRERLPEEIARARQALDLMAENARNPQPPVDPRLMEGQRDRLLQYRDEAASVYDRLEALVEGSDKGE